MKENLSKAIKLLLSLGLGAFLIGFFYHNISKPKDLLLDSKKYANNSYEIKKSFTPSPAELFIGDTIYELKHGSITTYYIAETEATYLLSKSAGDLISPTEKFGTYTIDLLKIIKKVFRSASWFWLILSLLASLLGHVLRSFRWRMMLQSMGYQPSASNTFFAVVIMYMANMALPRLGEVMRCEVIRRYEKIPLEKSLGSMLTERLVDVLCLLGLGLVMIVFQYSLIIDYFKTQFLTASPDSNPSGLFIKFGIIGACFIILGIIFVKYIQRGQSKFALKIKSIVTGLIDGIVSIKNVKNKFLFLIYTLLIWSCYLFTVFFCLKAVPETSIATLNTAVTCLFFGSLAIVAVQGGLGVYPLVIGKVLLLYNITESIGYANGWLSWIVQTSLILVLGFICMILLSVLNKEKMNINESTS